MTQWKVDSTGVTHMGMVRNSNQDSLSTENALGLYLVADGMGGRAGGEVASQLAVKTILSETNLKLAELQQSNTSTRRAMFCQIINNACLKIYERSLELPQYRGMGTTTTMLWIPTKGIATDSATHAGSSLVGSVDPGSSNTVGSNKSTAMDDLVHPDTAVISHVGDSRCYLLRSGFLYQITDDHSLVNEQVKAGLLKKSDPLIAQMRNVITRCVGYQEEEEVDTFPIDIREGDVFLICSDGLTNKIRDSEIAEYMAKSDIHNAANDMIRLANSRGGEDNITVILISVKKE